MIIFQHAAVHIDHKHLFKSIQKQRKLLCFTQSTYSTFTQPVHFQQTDLQYAQPNLEILCCSQFTLTWHCFRFLLKSMIEF